MTRDLKLKPCPFCERSSLSFVTQVFPEEHIQVQCDICKATGPIGSSDVGAAEAWNKREIKFD